MTRRIAFALLALAVGQTAVYLARPTTSYRLLATGHGATAVGLVAASFALVPLFVAIPLGRRADLTRGARLLIAGCALETVGCLLLGVTFSPLALGAASAVIGTGHLALALGAQAVVARESGDHLHDQHFALLTAGVSAGQLAGPLLAGALLGHRTGDALLGATTRAMFLGAAIALLAGVCAGIAERNHHPETGTWPAVQRASLRSIVGNRGVSAAIFASVAVLSATDVFTAYMPVLGEQRHIGAAVIGILLALRAGATLVSRIGITQLVRRFGRTALIAVAAGAAAVAFTALTFTDDVAVLAALAIVIGVGLGFAQPLSMTIVVQLVPSHVRASALALRLSGNRLGQVAAPAAAGVVAGSAGTSSVFWLTSGVLVASGIAVSRRSARGERVSEQLEEDAHSRDFSRTR